tara:strand:- start:1105 stop:2154 length:1050 start_codon:yes stop_codon:yes gene_type:complete
MAANTSFFSGKELQVGVAIDNSTIGTAASSFTAIESDSVSFPSIGDYKEEGRGGAQSGRFTTEGDLFVYEPGSIHEVSVSGFMTNELQALLMPNATGVAYAGDPDHITIAKESAATGSVNKTFIHNATAGADKTLSFAFNGVGESGFNDCIILAGCVITSFSLTWDANEDGGRIKFDLTASTRTPSSSFSTAASIGAYSTNYCYGTSYNSAYQLFDKECFFKSWSLNIDNPVSFLGGSDSAATSLDAGDPQTYVRSVPEMAITFASVVKYDTNLDTLWASSRATGASATNASTNGVLITDNSNNFVINIEKVSIEEIGWDEGDFLGLSTTVKARNHTSGTNVFKYVWNQ